MPAPATPGWFPDPDGGAGERWWNGLAWSDARRDPQTVSAPAAPAAVASAAPVSAAVPPVPVIYSASNPAPQSPAEGGPGTPSFSVPALSRVSAAMSLDARVNPMALYGLIAGIVAFFFNVFLVPSIVAIVFSARGLARANQLAAEGKVTTMRNAAVGGLAMGVISAIIGLVESLVFVGVLSSGFWS